MAMFNSYVTNYQRVATPLFWEWMSHPPTCLAIKIPLFRKFLDMGFAKLG